LGFVEYFEGKGNLLISPGSQLPDGPVVYLLCEALANGGGRWDVRTRCGEAVECGPFETRGEVRAVCAALFIPLIGDAEL